MHEVISLMIIFLMLRAIIPALFLLTLPRDFYNLLLIMFRLEPTRRRRLGVFAFMYQYDQMNSASKCQRVARLLINAEGYRKATDEIG